MSNKYAEALAAFLKSNSIRQAAFARAIGSSQPTVCHYAQGKKWPRKEMAKAIDRETSGQVPLRLWQSVALERADIY